MENIIIEVPLQTAKNWLEVPKSKRKKMANEFKAQIDLEAKKAKNEKLFKLMDEIGEEAKKNGLTPEILDEILKADD